MQAEEIEPNHLNQASKINRRATATRPSAEGATHKESSFRYNNTSNESAHTFTKPPLTMSSNRANSLFKDRTSFTVNRNLNAAINLLSYVQLQRQCTNAGLSNRGKATDLRKRLRAWSAHQTSSALNIEPSNENEPTSPRKMKKEPIRKKTVEEDLLCPLSLVLPFDPVMAEDGHVYERSAILNYFKKRENSDRSVLSPMSGKLIGQGLISSKQYRHVIETLIENGTITGALAQNWMKEKARNYNNELLKEAIDGDVDAIETVMLGYLYGHNGFPEDEVKAFIWAQKAKEAGSVWGMAEMGRLLQEGRGVPRKKGEGARYLGVAAEKGCGYAAYWLGCGMMEGAEQLPTEKAKAAFWLERSLAMKGYPEMCTSARVDARKKLLSLKGYTVVCNSSRVDARESSDEIMAGQS